MEKFVHFEERTGKYGAVSVFQRRITFPLLNRPIKAIYQVLSNKFLTWSLGTLLVWFLATMTRIGLKPSTPFSKLELILFVAPPLGVLMVSLVTVAIRKKGESLKSLRPSSKKQEIFLYN